MGCSLTSHQRGLALAAPWATGLLCADVLLSLLLPLSYLFPDFVYRLSSRIAYVIWRWIQVIFQRINGAQISISGDALPQGESAIVVSNHVGWCDFYMIQALAIQAHMLGNCRWFAKVQLRMVPFLGWGLWAMGMPMVSRDWLKDRVELERVFRGIVEGRQPTWLISYSEGTRLTPAKLAESRTWCAANGRTQPAHLLYPRTKGFVVTVQHLRKAPHVKAVYDVTIAYQRGRQWLMAPSMWETLSVAGISAGASGYRFHVHVRRFELKELPPDDDGLAKWLEHRWIEKGEWLEDLRRRWS